MASPVTSSDAAPLDFAISGRIVQSLVGAVELAGVPRARFLFAAQLDSDALELASYRPLCSEVYRLFDLALGLTGDPALGLHWYDAVYSHTFSPISLIVQNAPTLRHAFAALDQYGRLLTDHTGYTLVEVGDTVVARCSLPSTASAGARRFSAEILLAGLVRTVCSFGTADLVQHVDFEYPDPGYAADYARAFHGAARFARPHNEVVFARALMDSVSHARDDDVHRALRAIAQRRVVQMVERAPYAQQARDLLVQQASAAEGGMAAVARSLGLSERSLRRRFQEEGTSFHAVVDEARTVIAKSLLRSGVALPIQDLAHQLGFRDISSFYRAFKRWTGTTPVAYRESLTP
jgi:AraC-like DNA-binding protein